MILEALVLAFSWHFFKWLFRFLLVIGVGSKVKQGKESLLEQAKSVKGAMVEHEYATRNSDW